MMVMNIRETHTHTHNIRGDENESETRNISDTYNGCIYSLVVHMHTQKVMSTVCHGTCISFEIVHSFTIHFHYFCFISLVFFSLTFLYSGEILTLQFCASHRNNTFRHHTIHTHTDIYIYINKEKSICN